MVQINIYGSSDVHTHWKFPAGAIGSQDSPVLGGLALLQAFASQLDRSQSLLIDNGDTFNGADLASYLVNVRHDSESLLQAIETIGYDAMVPGNHDFDFGLSTLEDFNRRLGNPLICANLLRVDDGNPQGTVFAPYRVFEKEGIRIAVIGLITSATQQLSHYENVRGVLFADVLETLQPLIAKLRPEVDVLILSYHGGLERDLQTGLPTQYNTGEDESWRILSELSGIDGLISGHQHRLASGIFETEGRETAYVQPGYAGQYLGKLSFEFVEGQLVSRSAELVELAGVVGVVGGAETGTQATSGESKNLGSLDGEVADFEAWMDTASTFSGLEICKYIAERLHLDRVLLALPAEATWREIRIALQSPYQVKILRLPAAEYLLGLKALAKSGLLLFGLNIPIQPDGTDHEQDYRFAVNALAAGSFHQSRVEQQNVINFFDELLRLAYQESSRGKG